MQTLNYSDIDALIYTSSLICSIYTYDVLHYINSLQYGPISNICLMLHKYQSTRMSIWKCAFDGESTNSGMEYLNGILDWTTGLNFATALHFSFTFYTSTV